MEYLLHMRSGLRVSRTGSVIGPRGRELKWRVSNAGYARVVAYIEGRHTSLSVHRLVAELFVAGDGFVVNHKDGNKLNNDAENLEWCTYRDNSIHAVSTGLVTYDHQIGHKWSAGERNGRAKITWHEVREIRKHFSGGYARGSKPWESYGISNVMFRNILRGESWVSK